MKKSLHLWLGICLVALLFLPIHSMGAGNLTLLLPDGTGAGIADQPFDLFSLDSLGNLTVVLPNYPDITIPPQVIWTLSNPIGCTINQDGASISAEVSKPFSFTISTSSTASIDLAYPCNPLTVVGTTCNSGAGFTPGTSNNSVIFNWSRTQAGNFVAVFKVPQSQRVIDIHVSTVDPVAQFVADFYTKILNQTPPPTNTWVADLKNQTKTAADIATYFFNTSQGLALSDANFVGLLYELLLQRVSDPGGNAAWVGVLANTSRASLLDSFIHCGEFAQVATRLGILAYGTATQPQQKQLTASVSPAGAGTVTLNPAGGTYALNTVVNLTATATPGSGYVVGSWFGVDSSSGLGTASSTASVTMNDNKTITANFSQSGQPAPSPSPSPSPSPPPVGSEAWVWGNYPMFFMGPGEVKTYTVSFTAPKSYLKVIVNGLTDNTIGTFTWTLPDGTVVPGMSTIAGMSGAGLLVLRQQIPQGTHLLTVHATTSCYFKISIEAN